jgi:CubicO group peptidase (beta-lactamase class C family)
MYFEMLSNRYMRLTNFFITILIILFAPWVQAQVNWQHRTDSVARLIQQYYNAKDVASLYALAGAKFRQAIPEGKLGEITQSLHTQLGSLSSYKTVSWQGRIAKYKATFHVPMTMMVSLDDSGKLETFLIQQWEEDTITRKSVVLTNNAGNTALEKKVDSLTKPFFSRPNTVGLVMGIVKNDSTFVYGYGETKAGNKTVPDGNTLFEIGSITKTFTATLLADLVVKGKLSLDDPINKYLPDSIPALQYNGVPITIKALSNHTSGLPRIPIDLFVGSDPANPYIHYDNARLFNFLKRVKLSREQGKQYEYSNLAVGILGVILERVSGKSYEQLLQQHICKPLGMKNTRISLLPGDSSKFATGHNPQGKPTASWEFQSLAAAGGIRSSVNDMLIYARAQVKDRNFALRKAITLTHQQTFEYAQSRVGLGWHSITINGKKYHTHNGRTGGYFSNIIFNPESNSAIVILTNGSVDPGSIPSLLITWLDQK